MSKWNRPMTRYSPPAPAPREPRVGERVGSKQWAIEEARRIGGKATRLPDRSGWTVVAS